MQHVAELVRKGSLDSGEAAIVADWFERIANGEPATEVLLESSPTKAGRPKGKTSSRKQVIQDWVPSDTWIADAAHRMILDLNEPEAAFKALGKLTGMPPATVKRVYQRVKANAKKRRN